MEEIIHWADVIAEKALRSGSKHIIATGITPSGHIHIGNMREVVTADAVYRALLEKGADVKQIYIADNFDPLRKVYPFLPESYAEHVGKPLSEVPCPCGKCKNYAEHFLLPFLESLNRLGIYPEVYRADELYRQGLYTEAIKTALIKRDEIVKILHEVSGKTPGPEWSPFNPVCKACGKITTTQVTGFDVEAESVDYSCSCGSSGTVPMEGGGKLTWRVDWPARWGLLGITAEPFGKDHASKGGSYDTGKRISKELYGYELLQPIEYEWIMLGRKGAMSSSTGVVVSISDMLKVVPPEVLRYLIMRTKPEKHIRFDPSLPLLTLVDEYEHLRSNPNLSGFEEKVLSLSKIGEAFRTDIPFKHMITICQAAGGDFDRILDIVKRAGYRTEPEEGIRNLVDNVENWLEMFAPEDAKFEVKTELSPEIKATLSEMQKAFLLALAGTLEQKGECDAEDYHNLIYSARDPGSEMYEKISKYLPGPVPQEIKPKELFKAIYMVLLGQPSGPKAGWFLSSLEKDFLIKQFRSAVD
ncbi:MAG: lysine--tRNA ligase [Methanosarcinaceae archaeon]|nr:lysine--tRNA ligase [Methanosarcinaceae archaeon]